MPAPDERPDLEELARLGDEVFDRHIRPCLRPEDEGKFVALDVKTGGYEIDEDEYAAVMRLHARLPTGEIWLVRVGYPTAFEIRHAR